MSMPPPELTLVLFAMPPLEIFHVAPVDGVVTRHATVVNFHSIIV